MIRSPAPLIACQLQITVNAGLHKAHPVNKLRLTGFNSSAQCYHSFCRPRNYQVLPSQNVTTRVQSKVHCSNQARSASTNVAEHLVESAKRMAAQRAVDEQLSPHHSWVGIGSGSTVKYVVEAIAKLDRSITKRMTFVPTGDQSRLLIEGAGLRVGTLSQLPDDTLLDVSFDGADEIDDELNLIKGGGACLLQEKIVAAASKRFICVADCRKLSTRLGANWEKGIPIEVLPLAATRVLAELRRLGSVNPQIRQGGAQKAGPIVTDNGMWIIDAPFPPLALPHDPAANKPGKGGVWPVEELSNRLMSLPGVIDTGIFTGKNGNQVRGGAQKPVAVYLGMANGEVGKLGG